MATTNPIIAPDYSFAPADRIVAVELSYNGRVRPYSLHRNAAGGIEPDAEEELPPVTITGPLKFKAVVPYRAAPKNRAIVCVELSDWGPQEYLHVTGFFLGMTWPFRQEYQPRGSQPNTKQVEHIDFTFEKVSDVWTLTWESFAGASQHSGTRQTGSLTLVEGSAGSLGYVVLRIPKGNEGWVDFENMKFGEANQTRF